MAVAVASTLTRRRRFGAAEVVARLVARRNGAVGLVGTAVFLLVAVIGPLFFGDQALQMGNPSLAGPSLRHLMGTDEFGRDVLSRVVVGVRVSLLIGVGAVVVGGLVGVLTGILAGYFGGLVEAIVMRIWDALLAFPSIFMAIGTAALLGAGVPNIVVAVAIVNMPTFARLARAATLGEKKKEYVEAARTGPRADRIHPHQSSGGPRRARRAAFCQGPGLATRGGGPGRGHLPWI